MVVRHGRDLLAERAGADDMHLRIAREILRAEDGVVTVRETVMQPELAVVIIHVRAEIIGDLQPGGGQRQRHHNPPQMARHIARRPAPAHPAAYPQAQAQRQHRGARRPEQRQHVTRARRHQQRQRR
ncbi:hypothetical protein, partial [Elioraea sp.]|uniref:hypothetical protein n=1 Tax=Elioraea sp. TaxID=2185103 RepID=UPI00307E0AEE